MARPEQSSQPGRAHQAGRGGTLASPPRPEIQGTGRGDQGGRQRHLATYRDMLVGPAFDGADAEADTGKLAPTVAEVLTMEIRRSTFWWSRG